MERKYKVKKQLNGSRIYRKWADWSEGDIVVGTYVGTEVDKFGKNSRHLEIEDAFLKDKKFQASIIGKVLSLNYCGSLDYVFKPKKDGSIDVKEGDTIQVEYTGMEKLEKGTYAGKEAHTVSVCVVESVEDDSDEDLI